MTHEDFVAEEPKTSPVCVLTANVNENQTLDLVLDEGEPVSFTVLGSASIHLTGYYVIEDNADDQGDSIVDSLGIFDEESDDESFEVPSADQMDSDSDDDSDDEVPKIEEVDNSILEAARAKIASKKRKRSSDAEQQSPQAKKQKVEQKSPMQIAESPKKQQQQQPKSPAKSPQRVQKLRGGTVAEILTPGNGKQTASKGQKVHTSFIIFLL